MKRLIGLLFSAALAAAVSCGGADQPEEQAEPSSATVKTESERAGLETPPEVSAGSAFQVSWTGPDNQNDYVTIVEEGAPKGTYKSYTYTREGSSLQLVAPDTPGKHEVRYVAGDTKDVLVSAPIVVTEVEAELQAPAEVGAGSLFEVSWTGPDRSNDYITIVEKGAPQGTYRSYTYTREGSPLELTASEIPGDYEIRYVMGQSKRVLEAVPITVTPVDADLSAAEEVMVETLVEVDWSGPNNPNDYITIVEKGAPQGTYLGYTYTREGSPLSVRAPKTPGLYEIRYVTGQSKRILAQRPLTVRPLSATLKAPSSIAPGESLEVAWTGPNNPEDFIAVAAGGAAGGSFESRAYSRAGNPAQLFAPSAPGVYEIRYVLGKSNTVLATAPITVESGG